MATAACRSVGRQMSTASTSGSASASSNVAVLADRRKIEALAGSAEIALNVAEVAGERLLVDAAHRRQFDALDILEGFHMSAAHETKSKDRKFHKPLIVPCPEAEGQGAGRTKGYCSDMFTTSKVKRSGGRAETGSGDMLAQCSNADPATE